MNNGTESCVGSGRRCTPDCSHVSCFWDSEKSTECAGEVENNKPTNIECYIGGIEVALTTIRTKRAEYSSLTKTHDWEIFKALGELESNLFDIYLDKQKTVNGYDGRIHDLGLRTREKATYVENYNSLFKDIVENPDGSLNKDQVMRELGDYARFMETAAIVYEHVTGGAISKINTLAECIVAAHDDCVNDLHDEWLADYKDCYECMCDELPK